MSADEAEDAASDAVVAAGAAGQLDLTHLDAILAIAIEQYGIAQARRTLREMKGLGRIVRSWEPSARPVEDEVVDRHYVRWILTSAALSPQESQVVSLVFSGHRHTEVAVRLGVTPKASVRSLDRARSKLRRVLQDEVDPPTGPLMALR